MLSGLVLSLSQERSIILVAVVGLVLDHPTDLDCFVSWFSPYKVLKNPGEFRGFKGFSGAANTFLHLYIRLTFIFILTLPSITASAVSESLQQIVNDAWHVMYKYIHAN